MDRASGSSSLEDVLHRYWGFDHFLPLQREAMEATLSRRDSLVVLPTGGGKSICFQAPALIEDARDGGLALVVSPLISLMKDQVDGLVANGVAAAQLNSSLTPDQRDAVVADVLSGRVRLLYVSPERLVGDRGAAFQRVLARCRVRFIAIDEAHCISHWGHDFRPEYRLLGRLRDDCPGVSIHAFTATATVRVREDIVRQLGLRDPAVLVGSFDRPNLVYRVRRRTAGVRQIEEVVRRHHGEAGIIYCISRKDVDALAASLAGDGYRALPYHAGLTDEERIRNQDAFLTERIEIIVATVAFGMGIDRSDVRYVIHAAAPRSVEHYQQESGRAGRDGLEAECVLIFSSSDMLKWRRLVQSTGELTPEVSHQLNGIHAYAGQMRCRHRALVEYFGQRYDREGCGACDWCLHELEPIEQPALVARKILSCVARVRQRWGIAHVAAVLEGKASDQVKANGHDRLTTFGLLAGTPADEIRGCIEQLADQHLLLQTDDPYPVLQITSIGGALLKDSASAPGVTLYRQPRPPKRGRRALPGADVHGEGWHGVDRGLFETLRALRLQVARARGLPPYVIFHDSTLRDMARIRPTTPDQLRLVHGVGARKLEELGALFLSSIRDHCARFGIKPDRE